MAITVKFNYKAMELALKKSVEAASIGPARTIAKLHFDQNVAKLVEGILDDPAANEIMKGPTLEGSNFIKGAHAKAGKKRNASNLFSFLGFYAETSPISELTSYINKNFKIKLDVKLINGIYIFRTVFPSLKDIFKAFPHPDNYFGGLSWIKSLENGMANTSHYIRKYWAKGRSKEGVQISGVTKKTFSRHRGFFSPRYEAFIKNLNRKFKN